MRGSLMGLAAFGAGWVCMAWTGAAGAEPVRVMTFNIRYNTPADGDNRWDARRDLAIKTIADYRPDVLGVQEALRDQVDALTLALPGYACVGVGREADGGGEYSPLLLRMRRFDVMAAGTIWLSDTPDVPGSRTWGNTLPRICTWARVLDRATGRRVALFNTHWDHQSQPAREGSGRLIAERVAQLAAAGEPAIVVGDFNAAPDNPAIRLLTRQGALLTDTYGVLYPDDAAGTFHGFTGTPLTGKIDGVFVSKGWSTREAAIVRVEHQGRRPSDHFPVTAVVELAAE
ncbi:MAG TPA: endonuclease/exonuclease/phosphatase family protein [Lacipirellulaceae bacterium]|nr:endonuclease/exonuclease/phosphatase family protein [Lacipirellulaceae bacterium]